MNKKAQELSEWYAKLAENDNGWTISDGTPGCFGPRMDSVLYRFTINPPKPVKKVIDLSVCIKSGVLMEFIRASDGAPDIGKLTAITRSSNKIPLPIYVKDNNEQIYSKCRVMENYWHSWHGGDRPIPEGLTGEIRLRDKTKESLLTANKWNYDGDYIDSEIIAFKITGIDDGYRYEWMEE